MEYDNGVKKWYRDMSSDNSGVAQGSVVARNLQVNDRNRSPPFGNDNTQQFLNF